MYTGIHKMTNQHNYRHQSERPLRRTAANEWCAYIYYIYFIHINVYAHYCDKLPSSGGRRRSAVHVRNNYYHRNKQIMS